MCGENWTDYFNRTYHSFPREHEMKKRFFIAPLIVFVVVIAACNSDTTKSLNEYIAETEEAVERMADLLAQTEDRETETEEQITELDETAAETDEKVDGLSGALANLQSGDNRSYMGSIIDVVESIGSGTTWQVLVQAVPDEKYVAVGSAENTYNPNYPRTPEDLDTWVEGPDVYVPKINEAYVWGLTKAGDRLFYGTSSNVHCLVFQVLDIASGIETEDFVCECLEAADDRRDIRPPSLYMYDLTQDPGERLENLGEEIADDADGGDVTAQDAIDLLNASTGIRSAGALNGVVFLAGPAIPIPVGDTIVRSVNMFAFDASTGDLIDSKNFPQYTNLRKWLVAGDELYVGVGMSDGGAVLKWTGDSGNPFQFELVGRKMDSLVAELTEHDGRIFVSTWPVLTIEEGDNNVAGIWMSPELDPTLGNADKDEWEKVWSVFDYEPDPVTAYTYGGGALASFDGWLYWGTMHVPLSAAIIHFRQYGPPENIGGLIDDAFGTYRAITIFRGKNFDKRRWSTVIDMRWGQRKDTRTGEKISHERWGDDEFEATWGKRHDPKGQKEVELLYGESYLPAYDPVEGWKMKPNVMMVRMGMEKGTPEYGHSGFGNLFNNYCWIMEVYKENLYVGTMDWSFLLSSASELLEAFEFELPSFLGMQFFDIEDLIDIETGPGADLYRFEDASSPAKAVSLDGLGNILNYGIRTVVSDSSYLYLGTANPMNLAAEEDENGRHGGWELIEVEKN